jgi:hypothetical protein
MHMVCMQDVKGSSVPTKHGTISLLKSMFHRYAKHEVLIAMKILMVVFWIVVPCELVGGYQRDPSTGMTQYALPKIWNPSTSPHSQPRTLSPT